MSKGPLRRPGTFTFNKPVELFVKEYIFTTDLNEKPCWKLEGTDELLSTEKMADVCVRFLLDKIKDT